MKCAHHWLIEPAEGKFSQGVCRKCGAAKQFQNWMDDSQFDRSTQTGILMSGDSWRDTVERLKIAYNLTAEWER